MSRCVIYLRVSSADQVKGTSLESQEAICRDYAQRQGWTVAKLFTDGGISAKTVDRAGFQDMIRFAVKPANNIKFALLFMIDRFSRETRDYQKYRGILSDAGVRIVSAMEWFDESPEGEFLEEFLSSKAKLENKQKSRRIKIAMTSRCAAGYWVHQAPFGYRIARRDNKPVLEPDPDRAPIVVKIFNGIAAGALTPRQALDVLRSAGLQGARRGKQFALQSIHNMLDNEIYCGRIRNSYTKHVAIRAKFAGLVSEETFDRAQLMRRGREPATAIALPRRLVREEFPLRGFVVCGCGTPMTASWSRGRRGTRYAYYHCPNGCDGARIPGPKLEGQFVELLHGITLRNTSRLQLVKAAVLEQWHAMHAAAAVEAQHAAAKLKILEDQSARLLDVLLAGTITEEVYRARDVQIRSEIATLKASPARDGFGGIDMDDLMNQAEQILNTLPESWQAATPENKQRFQLGIFRGRITWSREEGFRTAATTNIFSMLQRLPTATSQVASPRGSSSNRAPLLSLAEVLEFAKGISEVKDLVAVA